MTPTGSGPGAGLRAIVFGSPDGSAWGAALSSGEGWSLVMRDASGSPVSAGAVRVIEEPDGGWSLAHEDGTEAGLALLAALGEPPEPPAPPDDADPNPETPPGSAFVPGRGPDLCRVTGTVSGRPVDWVGVRMTIEASRSARDAPGSARLVAGWFTDGSAVGLIAARPRRGDRPDGDAVSATLFDPERWLAVSDPRLSTTYDGSGTPARVNLELWIGEGDHEYPRRAAGEAADAPSAGMGAAGGAAGQGAALQVIPLRCHSRGEEGAGVYVLATF